MVGNLRIARKLQGGILFGLRLVRDIRGPSTVFMERRPTVGDYTLALKLPYPECDWILTRILMVAGPGSGQESVRRSGRIIP